MDDKKVIILAGGKGTRIQKYFPGIIKPLFPINGMPIIERQIKMFKDYTIFINCNVEDADKLKYLHLPLLIEKDRLGNAGALYFFRKELGKCIVIHCDELCSLNPDDLWNAHKDNIAMTMVIKNIRREKEFGLVIEENNKILKCTKDRWVNTGIYCINNKIFDYIDSNKYQDLDTDIFPKLIKDGLLDSYKFNGLWFDVGTDWFIYKAYKATKK